MIDNYFLGLLFTVNILYVVRLFQIIVYKRDLLNKIFEVAKKDVKFNRDWKWRYRIFESVSDTTMILHFWKPFDSFYPDTSFIEEGKEKKRGKKSK